MFSISFAVRPLSEPYRAPIRANAIPNDFRSKIDRFRPAPPAKNALSADKMTVGGTRRQPADSREAVGRQSGGSSRKTGRRSCASPDFRPAPARRHAAGPRRVRFAPKRIDGPQAGKNGMTGANGTEREESGPSRSSDRAAILRRGGRSAAFMAGKIPDTPPSAAGRAAKRRSRRRLSRPETRAAPHARTRSASKSVSERPPPVEKRRETSVLKFYMRILSLKFVKSK